MASGQTSNYGLNQWQASDKVLRTEFNQDNQKVDTALKGLDSKIDSSVSQLGDSVDSDLALLENRLSLLEGKVTIGSYVGNGEHASYNSCHLTFPKRPTLVLILGTLSAIFSGYPDQGASTPPAGDNNATNVFTWSGSTLSWYNSLSSYYQLNDEGETYHYLALYL